MRRIVYASKAGHDFSEAELMQLLEQARVRNLRHGVTGMLVYSAQSFLQLLEGEDASVEVVWDRIRLDSRHLELRVLGDGPVTARQFGSWSMGFAHPDQELLESSLPGYRASLGYPFISSRLLVGADAAETLLGLYSRRS